MQKEVIMKKKALPLAEVIWYDAEEEGEPGWNDFKKMKTYAKKACPLMRSIVYVVYESETHISMVSTLAEDQSVCSTCEKIPKGMIVSTTLLSRESTDEMPRITP